MIAATVHLIGITFYAIFASGELQPWAEPSVEEQKSWNPMETGYEKETVFDGTQINTTKAVNYGAVEHVAGNPFAYPNVISEETVQPDARDTYLHGNTADRSYWPNKFKKTVTFDLD